jgi:hypothetical protein
MTTPLRLLLAAACLILGTIASAADPQPAGSAEESTKIARDWVGHIDAGQYAESWSDAGKRFKAMVTQEKWVAAMEQVRQPLGSVGSRDLAEATFSHEAPRAPRGDYWIVKFATKFEGVAANEVVILAPETDGSWRVVAYFIRPAA